MNGSFWAWHMAALTRHNAIGMALPETPKSPSLTVFKFSQMHMGVAVRVTLFAPDLATAEAAGGQAFARFRMFDDKLSDYQVSSELNKLCDLAGCGPVHVSTELFHVLSVALAVNRLSKGAFDITCGSATKIWRKCKLESRLPTDSDLERIRGSSGGERIKLDQHSRTAEVSAGTRIDLGGIAKGYACDEAIDALKRSGVSSAMIVAGGDIAVSDPPPGKLGWHIATTGPESKSFTLANAALSVSGDQEQSIDVSGVRYSHVVDNKTGIGLVGHCQVTVVGSKGIWTDAIATAESIVPGASLPLIAKNVIWEVHRTHLGAATISGAE